MTSMTAVRARLSAATLSLLMVVFVSAIVVSGSTGPAGIQATTTDVVTNQTR